MINAQELYDIIDHCRDDTVQNFIEDLKGHLNDLAMKDSDKVPY